MDNIKEFKTYMKSLGVEDYFIEYLLMMLEGEKDLQSLIVKIEILHSEGIDINVLTESLMEDPFFVVEDPKIIEHNIEVLKKYIDKKELTKILEMNIDYLTVPENYLEQNIKMIKLLVSSEVFEILLKVQGEIFTFNSDYLEKRFEFFIKNGFKNRIEEFIMSRIDLFDMEEEEIKLEELY